MTRLVDVLKQMLENGINRLGRGHRQERQPLDCVLRICCASGFEIFTQPLACGDQLIEIHCHGGSLDLGSEIARHIAEWEGRR